MKKQFITTFEEDFINRMKIEAIKRGIYVNELIELAVKEYLTTEKGE